MFLFFFFDSTDGGALPLFLVGEVICPVMSVDERDYGKTHQVQTQQGLTDSSFLILRVVLHGRFLRS